VAPGFACLMVDSVTVARRFMMAIPKETLIDVHSGFLVAEFKIVQVSWLAVICLNLSAYPAHHHSPKRGNSFPADLRAQPSCRGGMNGAR
jgi:hypothetical protein